jgi:hypothetical protein
MDGSVFYGANKAAALDAVTVLGGSAGMTGTFKCYTTSAVAGAVIGTTTAPALYNPAASGVVLRILRVSLGAVAGTVIAASHTYGVIAAPVLSGLTPGPTPFNTFIGRGATFQGAWYTGITVASAATILFPSGISAGGALAAGPLFTMVDNIGGAIALPPGAIFYPWVSNAAIALTALVTVDVLQTPWVSGY